MSRVTSSLFFIVVAIVMVLASTSAQAVEGDRCNATFMDKGRLRPKMEYAFLMHQKFDVYRKADRKCDGHLTLEEIQAFEKEQTKTTIKEGEANIKRLTAEKPLPLDKNGDPPVPVVADDSPSQPKCSGGWQFLLRDSAEDIGTYNCPKSFKTASGAGFGYAWDGVANNTSWSAKGVATLAYTWQSDGPTVAGNPYIAGYTVAPWASFNRLTNTAASLKSKQTDLLSLGGTGEIIFANIADGWQFIRAKPSYNTDFEGRPHSWSQTVEWQPLSNDLGISAPNGLGPLTWEVDPILRYQYTEAVNGGSVKGGSPDPIFAHSHNVSRIGPVIAWTIAPKKNDLILPHWLQSASFNGSFEWLHDVNSGKDYRLLDTTLTLPLDETGHFGLKVNYQNGQLEQTAQTVQQTTAGLAAKW